MGPFQNEALRRERGKSKTGRAERRIVSKKSGLGNKQIRSDGQNLLQSEIKVIKQILGINLGGRFLISSHKRCDEETEETEPTGKAESPTT